jgi:hypothetical protein
MSPPAVLIEEPSLMLYFVARLLQLVGLILVPVAVAGNLAEIPNASVRLTLGQSLMLSTLGVLIFFIGYSLQQKVRPQ